MDRIPVLNLSQPATFEDLNRYEAADLLKHVMAYCTGVGAMHPTSLKNVVLKLTYLSREMSIAQEQRDRAADLATSLAHAAIQTYGNQSEYCRELVVGVRAILEQEAA